MDIHDDISDSLQDDYVKAVPYQIKKIAVKDCCQAYSNGISKYKKTKKPFELHYRKKYDPEQSCYIPKSAIKEQGIYYTILGKLKYNEKIDFDNLSDARLVFEDEQWFLCYMENRKITPYNNHGGDIVAIDPGVRTFASYFSTDGYFGQLGKHDFGRIQRLCFYLDKLLSKRSKEENKLKRGSIVRAIKRVRRKIKNIVSELHKKVALFFAKNFKVVIYPYFDTGQLVIKGKRKINSKSARNMLTWSFFKFEKALTDKCQEYGSLLVRCSEAYTSRTNSFTGKIMNIGSREFFKYDGLKINRDINGARGILLRALRDTSASSAMANVA